MIEQAEAIWTAIGKREARLARDRALLTQAIGRASVDPGVGKVFAHGIEVFGGEEQWVAWLCDPNPTFAGGSGLEMLATGNFQAVDDDVTRIEYAEFS